MAAPSPKLSLVLGAFAGGGVALGQAPFSLWWVATLGILSAFYLFANTKSFTQAAFLGWVIGTAYFAGSMYWIISPFKVDAARHGWMAPFALAFLSAGLALLWALGFGWARWVSRRAFGVVLAVGWGGAEMLRSYLFTGLPWGLVGYTWLDTPFAQFASIVGPFGLTLITFLVLGSGFGLVGRARLAALLGSAAMIVVGLAFGEFQLDQPVQIDENPPTIRLVQTNAAQHEKWRPDMVPVFWNRNLLLTSKSTAQKPDLIVWPETAIPYLLNDAGGAFEVISQAASGAPAVAGIQREDESGFYNSMVVIGAEGQVNQTYDKSHLVPFGEFIPGGTLAKRVGLKGLADQLGGGYQAGLGDQLLDFGKMGSALPLICYEAVFPRDVHSPAGRADWILHITNDAWFGEKAGPYQHLAQARMRAIEQGLPLVRAANTGISALIDPVGRVVDSLPMGVSGALDISLPLALPATVFSETGNRPLIVLFLMLILSLSLYKIRHSS